MLWKGSGEPETWFCRGFDPCPLWVKSRHHAFKFEVRYTPESGHPVSRWNVRYVPIADVTALFDNSVRPGEYCRRDG